MPREIPPFGATDDADVENALEWFLGFLNADDWKTRVAAIERNIETAMQPRTRAFHAEDHVSAYGGRDRMEWYLYLVDTALRDPLKYEPIQGARILEFLVLDAHRVAIGDPDKPQRRREMSVQVVETCIRTARAETTFTRCGHEEVRDGEADEQDREHQEQHQGEGEDLEIAHGTARQSGLDSREVFLGARASRPRSQGESRMAPGSRGVGGTTSRRRSAIRQEGRSPGARRGVRARAGGGCRRPFG